MNNTNKSLIVFLLIIFLCQNSAAKFDYIFLEDKVSEFPNQNINMKVDEILTSIILLPNVEGIPSAVIPMINQINLLPKSLLYKIKNNRIKIYFFFGKLTDTPVNGKLRGITPRGYTDATVTWDTVPGTSRGKMVFVKIGANEKGQGHDSINLVLHELAHSIDRVVFNRIRDNSCFLSIWKLEVEDIFGDNNYYLSYPEEYFAETFALYYANHESNLMLKKRAPKTYEYIRRLK